MRGADIVIRILEKLGIRTISGIPGGSNLPLYDALYGSSIRHILARHEQAAGFIAQGMARSTGKTAVCFATSGPGVTNLLTAIADARMDSVPIVAITGQVPLNLIGTDAFQEVDTYGLSIPITKHNFMVKSVKDIPETIQTAFRIASSGRPGPVLIDIPKDVQLEQTGWNGIMREEPAENNPLPDEGIIDKAAYMIGKAQRPLLIAGGGAVISGAALILRDFSHKKAINAVSTLMGLGVFSSGDPLFLGMIGMHGSECANYAARKADLIIACGTRFGDRSTGKVPEFCPQAKIIHIDIDNSEFGKIMRADCAINGDIKSALTAFMPGIPDGTGKEPSEDPAGMKRDFQKDPRPGDNDFFPASIIRNTGEMIPGNSIITTDVGQHQMWVAKWYPFREPRTFLTSGGLGTMGFGLPAAIGAALSNPSKKVVCFTSDGSILMNIQELATLSECGLNVAIIVMNNGNLGLVRQQQDLFYNKRFIASKFIKSPDFMAIGEAFGLASFDLASGGRPMEILAAALDCRRPCIVNVPVLENTYALPMVPPGSANSDMILSSERNNLEAPVT
jgi:acetolactate synthase-1/2/3 large subunit